jgi:hypothetical protein
LLPSEFEQVRVDRMLHNCFSPAAATGFIYSSDVTTERQRLFLGNGIHDPRLVKIWGRGYGVFAPTDRAEVGNGHLSDASAGVCTSCSSR